MVGCNLTLDAAACGVGRVERGARRVGDHFTRLVPIKPPAAVVCAQSACIHAGLPSNWDEVLCTSGDSIHDDRKVKSCVDVFEAAILSISAHRTLSSRLTNQEMAKSVMHGHDPKYIIEIRPVLRH